MVSKLRIKLIGFIVIGLFLFHIPATPSVAQTQISSHSNYVNTVEWNPNGTLLASGSTDETSIVWDTNGDLLSVKKANLGPNGSVLDISWLNDQTFFTADTDRMVFGWNVSSDALAPEYLFDRHNGFVKSIDVHPLSNVSKTTIASGGDGSSVFLYDITTSGFSLKENLRDHPSSETVNTVKFSGDGETFMTAGDDKTVRLYDVNMTNYALNDDQVPLTYVAESQILSADISQDGQTIVISTRQGVEVISDISGILVQTGSTLDLGCTSTSENPCLNTEVKISHDGSKVAVAIDNQIAVYSLTPSGIGTTPTFTLTTDALGFEPSIKAVAVDWHPDNTQLAIGVGADVIVYDTVANSQVFRIQGEIPEASNIIFIVGAIIFLGLIAIYITRRVMNRGKL